MLCLINASQYYGSLNVNRIADNKNFWRVVKPNFSNKILGANRAILGDGGKIISDTEKITDTFKKFFVNIGKNLKIDKDKQFLVETNDDLILFMGGKKAPPRTSFSPVTSTNVGIRPQNILTFGFNRFTTLV